MSPISVRARASRFVVVALLGASTIAGAGVLLWRRHQRVLPADAEEALRALKERVAANPDNQHDIYALAEWYSQHNQPAEAILLLEGSDQKNAPAEFYQLLGSAYLKMRRLRNALTYLREATQRDEHDTEAWLQLGEACQQLGRLEEAKSALEKAVRWQPWSARPLLELGRMHFYQLTQPDAAMTLFRRAIELEPRNSDAHYNLGLVYHFTGCLDDAARCFHTAMRLNPRNARYHAWEGTIHLEHNELPAAVVSLRQAVLLDPRYAHGHYELARAYLKQGKLVEAKKTLEKSLALNPAYKEARYKLAQVYLQLRRTKEAEAELATFQELDALERQRRFLSLRAKAEPKNTTYPQRLAELFEKRGLYAEALAAWERVLDIAAHDRDAHKHLVVLYERMGDRHAAQEEREALGRLGAQQ